MAVITFPDNPSIGDRTFDQRWEWSGIKWVYLPPPQIPGNNGWSPVFGIATDSARRVLVVVDWTGGAGTKPAINVYVGTSGFVSDIADGINIKGADGRGITSLVQTSGTGAAGTVDTYTITFSDATTTTFDVYNGADGVGSGDMLKSAYDSNDDGKVNSADAADSVPWSGVTGKPVNATTSVDGFLSAADKTKLDSVSTGATANSSDATLLNRANHTGTQAISTVTGLSTALTGKVDVVVGKQLSTEDYSSAEKSKLAGIATGATANSSDATLLNRANHTGTQALSTLSQSGASTGQVPQWSGSAWLPTTPSATAGNFIIPTGLVGDGVTDDRAAIQTALNTGRPVYLPATTNGYKLSARLQLNDGNQLFGDERNTKIVGTGGEWFAEFRGSNIVVQNFIVDFTASAGGVFLFRSDVANNNRVFIRNIESQGSNNFILDLGTTYSIIYLYVENCIASLHRGAGVTLSRAFAYLKMRDVTIDYVGSASRNHIAFKFIGNQGAQLAYLDVTNGLVDGINNADGFQFTDCIAVWMDNCMADTVPGIGFNFTSGCSYFYVDNCVASLCGGHGFSIPVGTVANELLSFTGCVASGRVGLGVAPANANGFNYGAARCTFSNIISTKNTGHGFESISGAATANVTCAMLRSNTGRGVKAVNGSFLGTSLTMLSNTAGNYDLGSATQHIQASMNNAGGLVNVTGPGTA